MFTPVLSGPACATESPLEAALSAVEMRLVALAESLRARDTVGIDAHARELQRSLASAVERFTRAARSGTVPANLRLRLAQASGQVAAQREALARATAALDMAIDVLLPSEGSALYSIQGGAARAARTGTLQA